MTTIYHNGNTFNEDLMFKHFEHSVSSILDFVPYLSSEGQQKYFRRIVDSFYNHWHGKMISRVLNHAHMKPLEPLFLDYLHENMFENNGHFMFGVQFFPEWFIQNVDRTKIPTMSIRKDDLLCFLRYVVPLDPSMKEFLYPSVLSAPKGVDVQLVRDALNHGIEELSSLKKNELAKQTKKLISSLNRAELSVVEYNQYIVHILEKTESSNINIADSLKMTYLMDIDWIPERLRHRCVNKKLLSQDVEEVRWFDYIEDMNGENFLKLYDIQSTTTHRYIRYKLDNFPLSYTLTYLSVLPFHRTNAMSNIKILNDINGLLQLLNINVSILVESYEGNAFDIFVGYVLYHIIQSDKALFDMLNDNIWVINDENIQLNTKNPEVCIDSYWNTIPISPAILKFWTTYLEGKIESLGLEEVDLFI